MINDSETEAASRENGHPTFPLPTRSDRWQPLRCGLLNVYRYDEEEFRFEHGRLLLRGDNGTGKSRILAMQLPFLLDGEVSPARVEPDGDPAKRIEWNLLMGRWPDRTGYTWIEFGRADPEGTPRFLTLGCGMRAVAGQTGLRSRWFFVTRQRVGGDLFLQSAERRPLGRERLEQAIGDAGSVFTGAEAYRRKVDDELFGLGPRYERLVDLLIRLRRPKLSQKLDENELSETLSDALPTLPQVLIDEVAEAFRSLQAERDALRGFAETRAAVEDFLREYGLYARVAVRRRAAAVRSANTDYEEAQRAVRNAERRSIEAETRLAQLAEARAAIDSDLAAADEAARTLRASPEMRTAEAVANAQKAAAAAGLALQEADADAHRAGESLKRARDELQEAEKQHDAIGTELNEHRQRADHRAFEAGLDAVHRKHLPPTLATDAVGEAAAQTRAARSALERAIHQQRTAVTHLRTLDAETEKARQTWDSAESVRRRAADACTAAREKEREAQTDLDREGNAYLDAFEAWRTSLIAIPRPKDTDAVEAFSTWLEQRAEINPLRTVIDSAHGDAIAILAAEEARLQGQLEDEERAITELRSEIDELESGKTPSPPAPATRRAVRTDRPGAPLWKLCDFRPETPDDVRAGLEAALQASGLLDAWMMPDGRVVDPDTEDTFLRSNHQADELSSERNLGRWLIPAVDFDGDAHRGISAATVEQLLRVIGCERDAGAHWMGTNGSWRLGPVTGHWSKSAAEFIGESTRAASRRRRLAELRGQCAEREAARDQLQTRREDIVQRRATADVELAAAPNDRSVLQAGFRVSTAARDIAEAFEAHERAETEAAARRAAFHEAEAKRNADADDLRLRDWLGRLDELERATTSYEVSLAALWPTLHHWKSVAGQLEQARQNASRAATEAEERAARQRRAAEETAAAKSRHETLQAMHGASVAAVLEKLEQAERRIRDLKGAAEKNQKEQIARTADHSGAESDRTHATVERTRHEGIRRMAIDSLRAFAAERLLGEAHEELASVEPGDWPASRAVEIARQIEPLLTDTPAGDEAWQRRQDAIHVHVQELRDRLIAHDHRPETHQIEDFVLVRCVFQSRSHTMTELRDAIGAEIRERERLLAAREQEIIENHLLGEVAVELQRLIRGAEEWIASANRELATRPTSTGLRFRFAWEPAADGAFSTVRRTFLRTSQLWNPAERADITRFLQERIRAEQTASEDGSWRDHLGAALDYRRWHRFLVERQQEGQWRRLDKRTYGTGSGGEKALALTLPRFAAAAAHYRSARKDAPRLIMLDEAFAGIDPTMRAQCRGVLAQFDLDVVMTSELEWGCYATVPGLAIYHLTAFPGIDAVASTFWVWNGRERRQMDIEQPPSMPATTDERKEQSDDFLPIDVPD